MTEADTVQDSLRYAALKAKDARFDGRFFVGVSSTGIYCRPICRAKTPMAKNCSFFETAAAAEGAGFRPCLLCRPETAPGTAPVDVAASLARRAAQLLNAHCSSELSLPKLAAHLGCTDRHLRRVFTAAFHVTPVQYLQTCRLLLAKNLLSETRLPVLDVAMAAGFGSLRRFNTLFQQRYRMAPTALRRQIPETHANWARDTLAVSLGYRPPYAWSAMLAFLAARAIPGVEQVQDDAYMRTVRVQRDDGQIVLGWVHVSHQPQRHALRVRLSSSLLPVLAPVLAKVKHLFDLEADPLHIHEALLGMSRVNPSLPVLGLRLPGCFDSFEMLVRAVLGQQITVKAARTLAHRMVQAFGEPVATEVHGLSHAFPSAERLLALPGAVADHLGPLGITGARARTIQALAQGLVSGQLLSDPYADPEAEMQHLMAIPGIGAWTANYMAMRAMAWPDAFLPTDVGVKKALAPRTPRDIATLAEAWRPWRSYATINLWQALSATDPS